MSANVCRIAGKAMFTIVTSRNTMNTASEESEQNLPLARQTATTPEWTYSNPRALDCYLRQHLRDLPFSA